VLLQVLALCVGVLAGEVVVGLVLGAAEVERRGTTLAEKATESV